VPDLKEQFSPDLVRALAAELSGAWPEFPARAFVRRCTTGLADLELLQRVHHISAAMAGALPADFAAAAMILDRAVDSPALTGWMAMPCGYWVAAQGLEHPEVALPLLARLTPRFSSEFPIRPFIERHPEITFGYLHRWVDDPDEHVRRLVSEGSRPRLPWASRLRGLLADPSPAVALLDRRLFEDPSEYVRRSVANHLNDIAKDHPGLALETARRWQATGSPGAAWVVRHGLRTLIKHGDPQALALLGFDHAETVRLGSLSVTPAAIAVGDEVLIEFELSTNDGQARVAVDYLVHYAGARGTRRPKVFKLTTRTIEPGRPQRFSRRHRFADVSIRTIHPGTHRLEVQVNGVILGGAEVEVTRRASLS
jgi:3-methyladenine DNA glycosylase AlkC